MQVYKAIKYIRLSYTDDKTVESDSVANQRRLIDDYIARHPEIEVVAEKIDDGYSGVLFDRPAFQEMMRMIEQGEANCVIVKDLSRLGREYIETGRYMRRVFPAYGVRFIAINDNVDTENDAADDLTVSVKNIMNEAYCRDISVKTRSALEVKRRSGDFVGAFTIYGYVKVGDKHKSLEVDEYAANVVRDIFRKRLEGFSASHIADELNRLGILSPLAYKRNHGMPHAKGGYTDRKDCKWSATTIIRILQDETYTGTLVQGKQTTPHFKLKEREDKPSSEWIRVEGTHEAIIQKHDFDLVQRLRRIDTRTSPKSDKVYLFSGILICGCCGCRMTRKTNRYKDKEYHYYYCPTGKKNGCTSSVMLKESDLIECVQDSLKGHIENVASLDALLSSISQERINRELAQEYAAQIRVNEKRVAQTEGFKAKLYENLVSGILTKEEFLSYKRKYNADIELFQKAIAEWNDKLTDVLENRSERNRWINHFMKFSTMEDIDRRGKPHCISAQTCYNKYRLFPGGFSYDPAATDLSCHCGRMRQHHGRRRAAVSLAAEFERRDSQFREGDGRYRLCALKQGRNRHAGGRGAAFVCTHAARAGRHHAGALRRGQKACAQVLRVMSALFVRGERIRRGCQGVQRGPVRFYPAGNTDR